MSDPVSFTEIDGQHVELLPARTVLSLFSATDGGTASSGAPGVGTVGVSVFNIPLIPGGGNSVGSGGASADG